MKKLLFFLPVLPVFLIGFFGCTQMGDESEIESLISSDFSSYFDLDVNYGRPDSDSIATPNSKAYQYVFWFRERTDWSRNINISIEGDSAFVTFTRNVEGILHRYPFDTPHPPDTLVDVPKSFSDAGEKYAIFKRIGDLSIHRGWVLTDISGATLTSPTPSFHIDSVKVMDLNSNVILFVKDPLTLQSRDSLLSIPRGTDATITVYTSPESVSVCVFVHTLAWGRIRRYRIREQNPGVYKGIWRSCYKDGIRRLGVDVIKYETLFEDDSTLYPYDADAWIIPYVSTAE